MNSHRFEYSCDGGHWVGSDSDLMRPEPTTLGTRCPAWVKGSPCPYALHRVGEGSRSRQRETAAAS